MGIMEKKMEFTLLGLSKKSGAVSIKLASVASWEKKIPHFQRACKVRAREVMPARKVPWGRNCESQRITSRIEVTCCLPKRGRQAIRSLLTNPPAQRPNACGVLFLCYIFF